VISRARYIFSQKQQSQPISISWKVRWLCSVLMFFSISLNITGNKVLAQNTTIVVADTIKPEPKAIHSPHKATIYALVLPGMGQLYNRKYWKVPIVYAGFGTCIYFIISNSKTYHDLKDAYVYESITKKIIYPPTPVNLFPYVPDPPNDWAKKDYTEDQLKTGMNLYRRYLEISYIATGAWYILSIVDAVVDAHFFDYDISNNLTLNVKPWVPSLVMNSTNRVSGGINLTLRF
jgi:hypothetical protein